jgi:hypothetical protein
MSYITKENGIEQYKLKRVDYHYVEPKPYNFNQNKLIGSKSEKVYTVSKYQHLRPTTLYFQREKYDGVCPENWTKQGEYCFRN